MYKLTHPCIFIYEFIAQLFHFVYEFVLQLFHFYIQAFIKSFIHEFIRIWVVVQLFQSATRIQMNYELELIYFRGTAKLQNRDRDAVREAYW